MRIVRTGVTRTVVLVGRFAVKVPSLRGIGTYRGLRKRLASFASGYSSNLNEAVWSEYEPWQGKVAPVLRSWLWGVVQVYPRCDPMPPDGWSYDGGWTYSGTDLPEMGRSPGDFKPDNLGLLDGRVVWLDYGW